MLQLPDTTTEAGQLEASMMLARLMGWKKPSEMGRCDVCGWPYAPEHESGCRPDSCSFRPVPKERVDRPGNMYDPEHMSLAWRVLNWATMQSVTVKAQKGGGDEVWQESWAMFIDDAINGNLDMYSMLPAVAHRAWLDKILELAVEAGMVGAAATSPTLMPCGHDRGQVVSSDEGTQYCGACADDAAAEG